MVDGILNSSEKKELGGIILGYQKIIRTAIVKGYEFVEILAYKHLAEVLRVYKRIGAGLSYDLKAYELIEKFNRTDVITRYITARIIGTAFYELQENHKAKFYIEKAISPEVYTKETRNQVLPRFRQFNILNYDMLSQIHLRLANYDSSAYYIDKAYDIYINEDTTLYQFKGWRGIFYGNRGHILFGQGKYNEAVPLYTNAIELLEKAGMYKIVASFGISLINCYIKLNNLKPAYDLLPKIQDAIRIMNPNPMVERGKQKINFDYFKILLTLPPVGNQSLETKKNWIDSLEY